VPRTPFVAHPGTPPVHHGSSNVLPSFPTVYPPPPPPDICPSGAAAAPRRRFFNPRAPAPPSPTNRGDDLQRTSSTSPEGPGWRRGQPGKPAESSPLPGWNRSWPRGRWFPIVARSPGSRLVTAGITYRVVPRHFRGGGIAKTTPLDRPGLEPLRPRAFTAVPPYPSRRFPFPSRPPRPRRALAPPPVEVSPGRLCPPCAPGASAPFPWANEEIFSIAVARACPPPRSFRIAAPPPRGLSRPAPPPGPPRNAAGPGPTPPEKAESPARGSHAPKTGAPRPRPRTPAQGPRTPAPPQGPATDRGSPPPPELSPESGSPGSPPPAPNKPRMFPPPSSLTPRVQR